MRNERTYRHKREAARRGPPQSRPDGLGRQSARHRGRVIRRLSHWRRWHTARLLARTHTRPALLVSAGAEITGPARTRIPHHAQIGTKGTAPRREHSTQHDGSLPNAADTRCMHLRVLAGALSRVGLLRRRPLARRAPRGCRHLVSPAHARATRKHGRAARQARTTHAVCCDHQCAHTPPCARPRARALPSPSPLLRPPARWPPVSGGLRPDATQAGTPRLVSSHTRAAAVRASGRAGSGTAGLSSPAAPPWRRASAVCFLDGLSSSGRRQTTTFPSFRLCSWNGGD